MSAAQIHLALNHFPIAGEFFVFIFLLSAFYFKKKELIYSGMILAILSAIFVIPLNWSGEGAEEIIEHMAEFNKALVHDHEEAAEVAFIAVLATGLIAASWFIANRFQKNWIKKIEIIVFVFSFISLILIGNTAHLGGLIRHDELRSGNVQVNELNGKIDNNVESDDD